MSTVGQAMMKSVKANLSQKNSKNRYFDRKIDADQTFDNLNKAPKLTKEELAQFSATFKEQQRKWRLKVWGLSLFVSTIVIFTIYWIVS